MREFTSMKNDDKNYLSSSKLLFGNRIETNDEQVNEIKVSV